MHMRDTHGLCDQHTAARQGHHGRRAAKLGNHDRCRTPRLRDRALPRRDEDALLLTDADCAAMLGSLAA
jgi:hypothetical protein